MRLLVSVRDAAEAVAAVAGGCDLVDAKDPSRGPLGAVPASVLRRIRAATPPALPVSAALGDIPDRGERLVASACAAVAAGAAFVKVGVPAVDRFACAVLRAVAAAVRPGARLVVVGYADAKNSGGGSCLDLPDLAAAVGARAVMLDTRRKQDGRTLLDHLQERALARWIEAAHAAGLWAGLAGSLGLAEVGRVRALGPDVIGVRGAVCRGGRNGRVDAGRVAALRRAVDGHGAEVAAPPAAGARRTGSRPRVGDGLGAGDVTV